MSSHKKISRQPLPDMHIGTLLANDQKPQNRVMVGIPMTGMLRSEWVLARYGQVIPCNWSQVDCVQWLDQYSPINFMVADARNLIASRAVEDNFEWLFFIDHDVILPAMTMIRMNEIMLRKDIPIFGGLYFTKSVPAEPLIYRGRGNSFFKDWVLGEQVWCDGMGMGCTLIHVSILKAVYDESEPYMVGPHQVRKIFETPSRVWYDPETGGWLSCVGTEDLEFFTRLQENDIYTKAGWPKYAKKENPLLMDTALFCRHIDWNGVQYPARGEEQDYLPKKAKKHIENQIKNKKK